MKTPHKWTLFVIASLLFILFSFSLIAHPAVFVRAQPRVDIVNDQMAYTSMFKTQLDQASLRKTFQLSNLQNFNNLNMLLQPRVSGTPENKVIQDFLIKTLKSLNWDTEEDEFIAMTPFGNRAFKNIIATKDPRAENRLAFAAHYDSKYFKGQNFIGATDSAVPCAILLDLAHSLNSALESAANVQRPSTTLQLIFFDGEEAFVEWNDNDSIYGSRHLAQKWSKIQPSSGQNSNIPPIRRLQAMILLDLLGTKDAKIPNTHPETNWIYSRLMDIQTRLVQANVVSSNLRQRASNMRDGGFFTNINQVMAGPTDIADDHIPFYKLGVPICHVIAAPFPSTWHTMQDDGKNIDLETVVDLATIFRVLVVEYFGLNQFY